MLYLYDKAICDDLLHSFNPDNVENPAVRVIDPEHIVELVAQIQEDQVSFPIVALTRSPDTPIDTARANFTRMHKGVLSTIDPVTNELYYEKVIPIKLSYKLTVLTTNTADMDEMIRELLFKYISMYFLTITLPYECKRKVRFGVTVDADNIERSSSSAEYLESGQLYQSIIPLNCEGCVLASYTPAKLRRLDYEIEQDTKGYETLYNNRDEKE